MKELCPTCRRPYVKPSERTRCFCSNGFHCCRECVRVEGKLVRLCHDCEILKKKKDSEG